MKPVRKKYDFTEGPILPQLTQFMLPILGALVLQAMYGAVDILVVGRFGTTAGISGVSTGSNIINLVIFTIAGLSTAITVLIARYIGERHLSDAGKVIGGAIAFFSALSVVLAVILLIVARPFAVLMQAPAEALDQTVTYIRICGGGIFFIIAYNVISSVFRGMGNSRLPLIFVAIACVVNIVGDLLFVAVFHWDVAGAALATVLAQAVSVLLSLIIIKCEGLPFPFSKEDIGFNKEIRNIIIIGAPIAFQEIMTNLSFLALCAFINRLGLTASSAYGVANKIVSFVMLLPSTLMQSMSSFIAQNVGAGREDRARRALLTGMGIGCAIGVFVMCFSFFRGDLLAELFTEDAPVIASAADYLRGFAPEAIVTCILFSFMSYFNGYGQTLFVMAQGLAQTFIVRLPVSYIMSILPDTNLMLIGTAAPAATIFGIALNVLYYHHFQKRLSARTLR
ncbi:MAG: MATE family efflux transporter [Butyricicoccus sp.]|nr:MATE family efflux transporter [Butyricicoccus sp.]